MYDELDYLNYTDLNEIENKVVNLYNKFSQYTTDTYTPKQWQLNEFIYVDDIKHIEDGIDKIGSFLGYSDGFIRKREWKLNRNDNISYKDINRWLNNINIGMETTFNPLLPSNSLYPSETLMPSNNREE